MKKILSMALVASMFACSQGYAQGLLGNMLGRGCCNSGATCCDTPVYSDCGNDCCDLIDFHFRIGWPKFGNWFGNRGNQCGCYDHGCYDFGCDSGCHFGGGHGHFGGGHGHFGCGHQDWDCGCYDPCRRPWFRFPRIRLFDWFGGCCDPCCDPCGYDYGCGGGQGSGCCGGQAVPAQGAPGQGAPGQNAPVEAAPGSDAPADGASSNDTTYRVPRTPNVDPSAFIVPNRSTGR